MILTSCFNIKFLAMTICPLTQCKSFNVSCGIITLTHQSISMHTKFFEPTTLLTILSNYVLLLVTKITCNYNVLVKDILHIGLYIMCYFFLSENWVGIMIYGFQIIQRALPFYNIQHIIFIHDRMNFQQFYVDVDYSYLVDMFACIDQEQLHFIRTQQKKSNDKEPAKQDKNVNDDQKD